MKNILFFLAFLSLPLCAIAQDYAYEITSEAGDSTFRLDVITIINAARQSIQRTIGLDTTSLQSRQYSEVNELYERTARNLRDNDNLQLQRSNILASLNSLGLNQYIQWQVERNDSTFTGDAKYRDENGTILDCYVFPRDNLVPLLKLDSDNNNVASITFFSRNYIRVNWAAGYGNGDSQTFFYSDNGRLYAGYDATGTRHAILFSTQ